MGFGILEDRHMASPPGTSTINDSGPTGKMTNPTAKVYSVEHLLVDSKIDSTELKRDGDIILQPQPSDSPNDPLNWLVQPIQAKESLHLTLSGHPSVRSA